MPFMRDIFRFCAGFWTPASMNDPHAQLAGVRKAPRHEVAGCWALASSERYGDLMSAPNSSAAAGRRAECINGGW